MFIALGMVALFLLVVFWWTLGATPAGAAPPH
jgi:hypothetical protein